MKIAAFLLIASLCACESSTPPMPHGPRTLKTCLAARPDSTSRAVPSACLVDSLPHTVYETGIKLRLLAVHDSADPMVVLDPGTPAERVLNDPTTPGWTPRDSAGAHAYDERFLSVAAGDHQVRVVFSNMDTLVARFPVVATEAPYSVVLLPGAGGSESDALDVNDSGVVVGFARDSAERSWPALWRDGALQLLGALSGVDGVASAVSSSGIVAGLSAFTSDSSCHLPVRWTAGNPTVLAHSCAVTRFAVRGVNDAGHVLVDSIEYGLRFALYAGDGETVARPWLSDVSTNGWAAAAINDSDQIVGSVPNSYFNLPYAFAWAAPGSLPVRLIDYYRLTTVHTSSAFIDVNDAGDVLGWSNDTWSFDRPNEAPVDLTVATPGAPVAIASDGTVLTFDAASHAVYTWRDRRTTKVVLPAGWTIDRLHALNAKGQIVGEATDAAGRKGAVILSPAGP